MEEHKMQRRRRMKRFAVPALAAVILLGSLAWLATSVQSEALSPEEILHKQQWSDKELKRAFVHTMSPAMDMGRKDEIIAHLSNQLHKRPAADQDRIRQEVIVETVDQSLRQLRKMPYKERQRVIDTIHDKAEKSYQAIQSDARARYDTARQMQSKEFEVFSKEVNRVIFAEFTPEERVQFAPLTKVWIKTMKTMGR